MSKKTLVIGLLICAGAALCVSAKALESGEHIPVGAPDGRGPLAVDAVVATPVGSARVYGAKQPDLFVATGRFGTETGLFLYRWLDTTEDGTPVFGEHRRLSYPFEEDYPPAGTILQTDDGVIHGVWLDKGKIVHTVFDKDALSFLEQRRIDLKGLPRGPGNVGVVPNTDGSFEVLLQISDGTPYKPDDYSGRDARYRPYDGAGIWRGGHPYVALYAMTLPQGFAGPAENARRLSASERDVRSTFSQITAVNLGRGSDYDVVAGSHYGGLHYYRNAGDQPFTVEPRVHVVDQDGIAHRHPTVRAAPVHYPNPESGLSDLIAGGEGGLYFYEFTGRFTDSGKPIYEDPTPVLEQDTDLYAGTLPVPSVVDWDGDGAMDIVSGNSEGKILFFRNAETNETPAFVPGEELEANGEVIHVQPGYRMDIQGPGEARWGYACPTVVDWNGDELLDIVMSDSTARHTLYLNVGEKNAPRLAAAHPLYYDGLDLHGTWRVKPGVARLGDRMAYVALDEGDEFHLYWQVDVYNLSDGGKLRLNDGAPIKANFIFAGGTGRLKLNLVDWDRDGLTDLLVGTPRHGSVPDPEKGLPQSLGLPGSAVLFLRNVGTETAPTFEFPRLLHFQGKPIFLGQHACGPAAANFGRDGGPDLIVGIEDGRFLFYRRKDLSWPDKVAM